MRKTEVTEHGYAYGQTLHHPVIIVLQLRAVRDLVSSNYELDRIIW